MQALYGTIQQLQRQWESGESELEEKEYFNLQAKLTAQYLSAEKSPMCMPCNSARRMPQL